MIDNLVGLCWEDAAGFKAYIHADLIDRFVDWLNENNPEMVESSNGISWKTVPLDAAALLDIKESENLFFLMIGRNKIGYARGSEQHKITQDLLNQAVPIRSLRGWRV